MSTARNPVRMLAARRKAPGLTADIADLFHTLAKALFDPYRPELHYMRGPGPSGTPSTIRIRRAGCARLIAGA